MQNNNIYPTLEIDAKDNNIWYTSDHIYNRPSHLKVF